MLANGLRTNPATPGERRRRAGCGGPSSAHKKLFEGCKQPSPIVCRRASMGWSPLAGYLLSAVCR